MCTATEWVPVFSESVYTQKQTKEENLCRLAEAGDDASDGRRAVKNVRYDDDDDIVCKGERERERRRGAEVLQWMSQSSSLDWGGRRRKTQKGTGRDGKRR